MTTAGMSLLEAEWPAPTSIRAFTSLRHGAGQSVVPFDSFNLGNMRASDGDAVDAVASNRAELVRRTGMPSTPHWLRQVHGTCVLRVDAALADAWTPEQQEPEADAAVTSVPGAVLAVLSADCLPVLFTAADGREVGAAHAGWRGLADGVLERTVAVMHTPANRLSAWLGPAAGPETYEVGAEVFEAFVAADPEAADAFVVTRPGHWNVDLYTLARRKLAAVGVNQVYGGGLCTISDSARFFSHRRDRRSGRMASVIWIEPDGAGRRPADD